MLFSTLLVASAFAVFASAQDASTTVSQSMPPQATAAFNPGNVTSSDAENWCLAQQNTCPEICGSTAGGYAKTNTCNPASFTYSCICANGTEPDCTAYTQTLPYFICLATFSQCINIHANDLQGQTNCKTQEQCGTLNATALEASVTGASSSSASSTSVSSMVSSATGSSSPSSASSASAASSSPSGGAAVANVQQLATGTFAAVLFAAFKLLL